MKKQICSILLALSTAVCMMPCAAAAAETSEIAINSKNFPDPYFRDIAELYDDDGSGGLSDAEIAAATKINCSDEKIKNLYGIEYFTELQYLDCSDNEISKMDLSDNTKLETLYCEKNEITSLDLRWNTKLKKLDCSSNDLQSLDLSKNTLLTSLTCKNNKMTFLDLSNNPLITACSVSGSYTVQANADRTFDLSTMPAGFDLTKVLSFTGGSLDGNILTFDEGERTASYTYLCRQGITAHFTLVAGNLHKCTFGEWVSNGDGTHTRTCTVSGCGRSETEESTGTGTEKDPYLIETAAQLDAIRNDMNACYRLNADIVFTEADFAEGGDFYNGGKGWLPLGAAQTSSGAESAFRGIFDGNGHVIRGLYINRPSENDVGLFKYLGGVVKSLGMEDGQIIGSQRVGAIVGMVDTYAPKYGRLIKDCYNTCAVTAKYDYVAGIAGEGRGTIECCYNAGKIKSLAYGCTGGIVPIMQSGTISNCYNSGDLLGGYQTGGIAGQSYYSATISNCYSIGNRYCGGRYAGYSQGSGSVINGTSAEESKTIDEMKKQETFSEFDFTSVWSISQTAAYPYPTLKTVANAARQEGQNVRQLKRPEVPSVSLCTTKTIRITTTPGLYYSCEITSGRPSQDSIAWKQAAEETMTFSGLTSGKTYYLYAYDANADEEYDFCLSDSTTKKTMFLGNLVGNTDLVDTADSLYLKRYLAGWKGYSVDTAAESTADVNADGVIDQADLMVLERYLAGWAGYETLPVTTEQKGA